VWTRHYPGCVGQLTDILCLSKIPDENRVRLNDVDRALGDELKRRELAVCAREVVGDGDFKCFPDFSVRSRPLVEENRRLEPADIVLLHSASKFYYRGWRHASVPFDAGRSCLGRWILPQSVGRFEEPFRDLVWGAISYPYSLDQLFERIKIRLGRR